LWTWVHVILGWDILKMLINLILVSFRLSKIARAVSCKLRTLFMSEAVKLRWTCLSTTPWRRMGEWMYRSTYSWPQH
jgi:hypothetical protein